MGNETDNTGFDPDELIPASAAGESVTAIWNLMYRGKGGHDEHLSFKATGPTADAVLASLNREGIITTLEASGATAKFSNPAPTQSGQGGAVTQRPVVAAPVQTGPQRTCPNGHVMKLIPSGVSKATQKAYQAFYVCEAGCMGTNGRKYSENV